MVWARHSGKNATGREKCGHRNGQREMWEMAVCYG